MKKFLSMMIALVMLFSISAVAIAENTDPALNYVIHGDIDDFNPYTNQLIQYL